MMALVVVLVTALIRPLGVTSFTAKLPVIVGRTSLAYTYYSNTSKRNCNNGKQYMFGAMGDYASSMMGVNKVKVSLDPVLDQELNSMAPSWENVRELLHTQQTPNERSFRTNLEFGYGAAGSPLNKIRLYDESNTPDDVRVVFYRDSASWCPYCQKVWMCLEQLKIPYRIEKVNMRCYGDKPAEFTRLQPSGQIPVAIIDGQVYGQSNDILQKLQSEFASSATTLAPPAGREMLAQELFRLERQLFSAWMYWLTGNSGDDPERFESMFTEVLDQVEVALQKNGPFFLGERVSMVDIMFAPFLERQAASLLYYKGFTMRTTSTAKSQFPHLNKWFDAMEELDSYMLTKSDYYTHCWDLPPQLGGCVSESKGAPFRAAINGRYELDGSAHASWQLPLPADSGGVEPDWVSLQQDDSAAKREAVERISSNHEAIIRFAARGAGRKGVPPVMAPLADPNASPNEAVLAAVSCALRVVCSKMLLQADDDGEHEKTIRELRSTKELSTGVVDSLVYLRDRTGVPRDMRLPAARQLRAHLNWAISTIGEDAKAPPA